MINAYSPLYSEGFFNAEIGKKERYFLKKADRLKSRKSIESLFANGKNFSDYPIKTFWMPAEGTQRLQAGFAVSSRNFKKATDRNRIKRLMRESYRLQKNNLSDFLAANEKVLSLFFIYTGRDLPEYPLIFEKMAAALKRLIKLTNGNT